jgi:hypothetical protein
MLQRAGIPASRVQPSGIVSGDHPVIDGLVELSSYRLSGTMIYPTEFGRELYHVVAPHTDQGEDIQPGGIVLRLSSAARGRYLIDCGTSGETPIRVESGGDTHLFPDGQPLFVVELTGVPGTVTMTGEEPTSFSTWVFYGCQLSAIE